MEAFFSAAGSGLHWVIQAMPLSRPWRVTVVICSALRGRRMHLISKEHSQERCRHLRLVRHLTGSIRLSLGSLAAAFWECIRAWAKILSTNIASCPSCTPSMLVWKRRGHEKQRNAQTMKVLDARFLLHGLTTELVERMRPDRSTTFWPFRFHSCWGASNRWAWGACHGPCSFSCVLCQGFTGSDKMEEPEDSWIFSEDRWPPTLVIWFQNIRY